MATPVATPAAKLAAGILAQIDKIIRERGHGAVIIRVRDGKVQPIEVQRSYLPENLPE